MIDEEQHSVLLSLSESAATDGSAQPVVALARPALHRIAIRMALGVAVGGLLVFAFLHLVNLSAIGERLRHLNPLLAMLSGLVFLSAFAVRALRWRRFLAPDKVPARCVISIYFIAAFLNWLLPVQAGELMKTLLLRRSQGIPVSRSLATVGMDKSMDLLPGVALVATVPFLHLHLSPTLWVLTCVASAAVVSGCTVVGLVTWQGAWAVGRLSRVLRAVLPGRVFVRVDPFLAGFVDALHVLSRKPRVLLGAGAMTFVAVGLDALFCFLAFRAVGVAMTFPIALVGYTLYNLAFILPTPPGHLGSNELMGLLVFSGVFGFSRSAVGTMFVFSHPWTGILLTASGFVCARLMGVDLRASPRLGSGAEPAVGG